MGISAQFFNLESRNDPRSIIAEHANPAVPSHVLRKIKEWLDSGMCFDAVIENLWHGNDEKIHMWKEGLLIYCLKPE